MARTPAQTAIAQALTTINAPRPERIGIEALVETLASPDSRWRPHIEALFDEVTPEVLHRLVLTGVLTFELLARGTRLWAMEGSNVEWIQDMARLRMAQAAGAHPSHH